MRWAWPGREGAGRERSPGTNKSSRAHPEPPLTESYSKADNFWVIYTKGNSFRALYVPSEVFQAAFSSRAEKFLISLKYSMKFSCIML